MAIFTGPSSSQIRSSPIASHLRCSRRFSFEPYPTLDCWVNWSAINSISDQGTFPGDSNVVGMWPFGQLPFALPDLTEDEGAVLIPQLMDMSWENPLSNSSWHFGSYEEWEDTMQSLEIPSAWPVSPWTNTSPFLTIPYGYVEMPRGNLFNWTNLLWTGSYRDAPAHNHFPPINYGDSIAADPWWCLCQCWIYQPKFNVSWASGPGTPNRPVLGDTMSFQNSAAACRGRYRINSPITCFEASCELWMQWKDDYSDPAVPWTWGWAPESHTHGYPDGANGCPPGMSYYGSYRLSEERVWPKNFKFIRDYKVVKFPFSTSSRNVKAAFNYPGSESGFEMPTPEGSPAPTAMDGFVGQMVFHVFESPEDWESRTGWELSS